MQLCGNDQSASQFGANHLLNKFCLSFLHALAYPMHSHIRCIVPIDHGIFVKISVV